MRQLLLALALTACGTPQPLDSGRDAQDEPYDSEWNGMDRFDVQRGPDVQDTPDVPDASPVIEDPGPPDMGFPNLDADGIGDASDVTDIRDVGSDGGDASCDVCVEGTYRCNAMNGYLERCTRPVSCATWTAINTCAGSMTSPERCDMNACVLCGVGDAGMCPPSCTTDVECANMGRARCVNGHCARRGWVACTTLADCNRVNIGTASSGCVSSTVMGQTAMVCGGDSVRPCSSDVMCPPAFFGQPAWRCDVGTGFCVP